MADNDFITDAEGRLDQHLAPEHPRRYADSDEPTDDPATLRDEQRREISDVGGGPAIPVMTGPMATGMAGGGLIGAVVGAILALPFALLPLLSESVMVRLAIIVPIGAVAGAVAGATYFGARVPELSGESVDADNRPSSGSSLNDPRTDDQGR